MRAVSLRVLQTTAILCLGATVILEIGLPNTHLASKQNGPSYFSPSSAAWPAKRQRRLSEQSENDVFLKDHKPEGDRAAIAPKVSLLPTLEK